IPPVVEPWTWRPASIWSSRRCGEAHVFTGTEPSTAAPYVVSRARRRRILAAMSRLAPALQSFLELPADHRRIGPFHLVEPLGRGGFAPVWLAEEMYGTTKLRTAAVKIFCFDEAPASAERRPSAVSEAARRRDQITDEARALCRVEHPNIVRFYSLPMD